MNAVSFIQSIIFVYISQKSGINAGLALLHLKRMRQKRWDDIWHSIERRQHFRGGALGEGEQVDLIPNEVTV